MEGEAADQCNRLLNSWKDSSSSLEDAAVEDEFPAREVEHAVLHEVAGPVLRAAAATRVRRRLLQKWNYNQGWIDVALMMIHESLLFRFNSFRIIGSTSSKRAEMSSSESGGATLEIGQK